MEWKIKFLLLSAALLLHGKSTISALSDYQFYPGFGAYKYVEETTTWFEAFQDCREDGAHLLILNSQGEVDLFVDIANQPDHIVNDFWVGITDFYSQGEFFDIKGNSIDDTGYVVWESGFPTTWSNCVHISKSNAKYYNDKDCAYPLGHICEIELSVYDSIL